MIEDVINKDGINVKVGIDTYSLILLIAGVFIAVVIGGIIVNAVSKNL